MEQSALDRELAEEALGGHRLACVQTGGEAVAQIAAGGHDAVLMAARLPDGPAASYVEEVRATGHAIPIVGLVTTRDAPEAEDLFAAGVNAVLEKEQFLSGGVADTLAELLGQREDPVRVRE